MGKESSQKLRWENRRLREAEMLELGLDKYEYLIHMAREWNDEYGNPPCAHEWNLAQLRAECNKYTEETLAWIEEAHEKRLWPAVGTCLKYFGTWNRFIEAAGFDVVTIGDRRVGERYTPRPVPNAAQTRNTPIR